MELFSPANIYLFKVNNRNTRKRCKLCSKSTTKTPSFWCFIVNLNMFTLFSSVSVVDLEQVNVSWVTEIIKVALLFLHQRSIIDVLQVLNTPRLRLINTFHATDFFLYPLKISQNLLFYDIFMGYRKRPVAQNRLITVNGNVRAMDDGIIYFHVLGLSS